MHITRACLGCSRG
uniref:Uncharacterized protein n=1 Tax=Arundo donax TaxID=35708 RepID=A0A0A9BVB5_ARUDO